MRNKLGLCLVFLGALSTSGVAATVSGAMCRQDGNSPKVLELEKKSSGGLVARISGYGLFGGRVQGARSIEVSLQLSSCQPHYVNHWMDPNLYVCVGPDQPRVRDANGEIIELAGNFRRVYFKTAMSLGWVAGGNRFQYQLRINTSKGDYVDSGEFTTDGVIAAHECRLRYDDREEESDY